MCEGAYYTVCLLQESLDVLQIIGCRKDWFGALVLQVDIEVCGDVCHCWGSICAVECVNLRVSALSKCGHVVDVVEASLTSQTRNQDRTYIPDLLRRYLDGSPWRATLYLIFSRRFAQRRIERTCTLPDLSIQYPDASSLHIAFPRQHSSVCVPIFPASFCDSGTVFGLRVQHIG